MVLASFMVNFKALLRGIISYVLFTCLVQKNTSKYAIKMTDWQPHHKLNYSRSGCDCPDACHFLIRCNCWCLQAIRKLTGCRIHPAASQPYCTHQPAPALACQPSLCCLPLAALNKLKTLLLPYTGERGQSADSTEASAAEWRFCEAALQHFSQGMKHIRYTRLLTWIERK